jgi:hypothetical protein
MALYRHETDAPTHDARISVTQVSPKSPPIQFANATHGSSDKKLSNNPGNTMGHLQSGPNKPTEFGSSSRRQKKRKKRARRLNGQRTTEKLQNPHIRCKTGSAYGNPCQCPASDLRDQKRIRRKELGQRTPHREILHRRNMIFMPVLSTASVGIIMTKRKKEGAANPRCLVDLIHLALTCQDGATVRRGMKKER